MCGWILEKVLVLREERVNGVEIDVRVKNLKNVKAADKRKVRKEIIRSEGDIVIYWVGKLRCATWLLKIV